MNTRNQEHNMFHTRHHHRPGQRPRGFGGQHFGGFFGGRRNAVRRGDVRIAMLGALADQPMHGYQVIQELERRSGGRWRPSAGSVYPTLQQLEDEGLLKASEVDGRRTYELTDAGRSELAAATEGRPAWEIDPRMQEAADLRSLGFQVGAAAMQVLSVGSPDMAKEAAEILTDARRRLYRLLAEEEPATDSAPAEGETPA
jgi:DNA-binding PadR family transcriptional regulator